MNTRKLPFRLFVNVSREGKMSCEFCMGTFIKQKLGRCKQCMGINLCLLLVGLAIYLGFNISTWLAVQQVTLILFIWVTGILMVMHLMAWCFYYVKKA